MYTRVSELPPPTNRSFTRLQFLHNGTLPWSYAVGDDNGLAPIAFLSRALYAAEPQDSPDWQLAVDVADAWILQWPHRLPDGTFSRDVGWAGQPDKNASFLW